MSFHVTLEFVQHLLEQNAQLTAQVAELQQIIQELLEKKNKNSRNSSKPPSSDGYAMKSKSLRGKSDKKQDGQKGHTVLVEIWCSIHQA